VRSENRCPKCGREYEVWRPDECISCNLTRNEAEDAVRQQARAVRAELGKARPAVSQQQCPQCGARVYSTDVQCMECGAEIASTHVSAQRREAQDKVAAKEAEAAARETAVREKMMLAVALTKAQRGAVQRLYSAIRAGDCFRVEQLLDSGISPDWPESESGLPAVAAVDDQLSKLREALRLVEQKRESGEALVWVSVEHLWIRRWEGWKPLGEVDREVRWLLELLEPVRDLLIRKGGQREPSHGALVCMLAWTQVIAGEVLWPHDLATGAKTLDQVDQEVQELLKDLAGGPPIART